MSRTTVGLLLVEAHASERCVTALDSRCARAFIDTDGVARCDERSFALVRAAGAVWVEDSGRRWLRVARLLREAPPGRRIVLGYDP